MRGVLIWRGSELVHTQEVVAERAEQRLFWRSLGQEGNKERKQLLLDKRETSDKEKEPCRAGNNSQQVKHLHR